jgi:NAD(P)-dependent dehydrogenase (short-subunit alcohol dehydrogenase family)
MYQFSPLFPVRPLNVAPRALRYLPVEQPDADEVIKLIRDEGRKVVPLPGDIRDEKFCKQLVADAVSQLGGLDIFVSNAAKQVY